MQSRCNPSPLTSFFKSQVDAASEFDPVNTDPTLCPFRSSSTQNRQHLGGSNTNFNSRRVSPSAAGVGDQVMSWTPGLIRKLWDRISWEHSVFRYVWTLGHTCTVPEDPLWKFLWPSGVPPIPPKSSIAAAADDDNDDDGSADDAVNAAGPRALLTPHRR